MGKIKHISVGFNNINYSDEIDVGKKIYTRDYWTDILLFIDILISSGNFKPEIQKLLRKLTLERNPAVYIIYTNCSEEDNEGNVTLYKKFIDTVNIFCNKLIKIQNNNNFESDISIYNNEKIDVISCEDEINEGMNDLELFSQSKKIINNIKIETVNKDDNEIPKKYLIENNDNDTKSSNIQSIDCNNTIKIKSKNNEHINNKNNNNKENINIIKSTNLKFDSDKIDTVLKYNDNRIDTINIINCENEEIEDFVCLNQKDNTLLNKTKIIKKKIDKDNSKENEKEFIINENDYFESSKLFIENIPSTLKFSKTKKKGNNYLLDTKMESRIDKNNNIKNSKYMNIIKDDCYVKEITDESEEIRELSNNSIKNKSKKHKYLKSK